MTTKKTSSKKEKEIVSGPTTINVVDENNVAHPVEVAGIERTTFDSIGKDCDYCARTGLVEKDLCPSCKGTGKVIEPKFHL